MISFLNQNPSLRGLLVFLMGIGFLAWTLHRVLATHHFQVMIALLGPMFLIYGLGLMMMRPEDSYGRISHSAGPFLWIGCIVGLAFVYYLKTSNLNALEHLLPFLK